MKQNNSLSPSRCQTIIWTNAGIVLIRPLGTNLSKNINRISYIFIEENAFHNVVCERSAILSPPQCVNTKKYAHGSCIDCCGCGTSQYHPKPSGVLHWHWGNFMISPLSMKQPQRIWINAWWRHPMANFPLHWPFVRANHRSPVDTRYKGQWRGALMFSLIYAWISG